MHQPLKIAALVLILTACGKPEPAIIPPPESAAKASVATPAPTTIEPTVVPELMLALDGEGLRIFNSTTGASRLIAFGADAKQSMAALGRVLEEPTPVSVENEECRVEFARWGNGLTVWSSQSRFTGWSVTPGSSTISTASGVKIGSTRNELESAYDPQIMESSLGTEFLAGGLAGLLDSPGPDAKINNLWAGETCIAR